MTFLEIAYFPLYNFVSYNVRQYTIRAIARCAN